MVVAAQELETKESAKFLTLPQVASLDSVIKVTNNYFERNPNPGDVCVNLRACKKIPPESIFFVESLMSRIINTRGQFYEGKRLTIALPREKGVRDMLRLWNFQKSFEKSVGLLDISLDSKQDTSYFGENNNQPIKISRSLYPWRWQQREAELMIDKCLSFHLLTPDQLNNYFHPWDENPWTGGLAVAVINNLFDKDYAAPHFTGRILMESIYSAYSRLTDRRCNNIGTQTATSISPREFTWTVWDYGDSLIESTREAVKNGEAGFYTKETFQKGFVFDSGFRVTKQNHHEQVESRQEIKNKFIPTTESSDIDFLLSWLWLERLHPEKTALGHEYLVNSAVDIFNGSVEVYTDKYSMEINCLSKHNSDLRYNYDVLIREAEPNTPKFVGNMLVVHLPLPDYNVYEARHEESGWLPSQKGNLDDRLTVEE
ncbi:MAG: hypothetical protein V1858_05270 [Candidatus Gottesmanbacteria bacterium]